MDRPIALIFGKCREKEISICASVRALGSFVVSLGGRDPNPYCTHAAVAYTLSDCKPAQSADQLLIHLPPPRFVLCPQPLRWGRCIMAFCGLSVLPLSLSLHRTQSMAFWPKLSFFPLRNTYIYGKQGHGSNNA